VLDICACHGQWLVQWISRWISPAGQQPSLLSVLEAPLLHGNGREGYDVPGTLSPQQKRVGGPLTIPSGFFRGKGLERVDGPPSMGGSTKLGQPYVRVNTQVGTLTPG
jgi:hypothetical protein